MHTQLYIHAVHTYTLVAIQIQDTIHREGDSLRCEVPRRELRSLCPGTRRSQQSRLYMAAKSSVLVLLIPFLLIFFAWGRGWNHIYEKQKRMQIFYRASISRKTEPQNGTIGRRCLSQAFCPVAIKQDLGVLVSIYYMYHCSIFFVQSITHRNESQRLAQSWWKNERHSATILVWGNVIHKSKSSIFDLFFFSGL